MVLRLLLTGAHLGVPTKETAEKTNASAADQTRHDAPVADHAPAPELVALNAPSKEERMDNSIMQAEEVDAMKTAPTVSIAKIPDSARISTSSKTREVLGHPQPQPGDVTGNKIAAALESLFLKQSAALERSSTQMPALAHGTCHRTTAALEGTPVSEHASRVRDGIEDIISLLGLSAATEDPPDDSAHDQAPIKHEAPCLDQPTTLCEPLEGGKLEAEQSASEAKTPPFDTFPAGETSPSP